MARRRWWDRFGIAAPRVAVRPHVPWYLRVLGTMLMLAVSVALGAWLYDAVRQTTGTERQYAEQAQVLRTRIDELQAELAALRSGTAPNGSAMQIERTTHEQLVRQVAALEEANSRLKEDLALFEKLEAIGSGAPALTISGLKVEADAVPGQYRYRALVASHGGKGDREFKGSLQLIVALGQGEGHVMMVLPAANDSDRQRYALNFRHFRRVDGTFQVPEGARPTSVEVRLLQDGATRASQRVTL